jgi:hypothetical protein
MAAAFDKLDKATAQTAGVRKYETGRAIEVMKKVRDQLSRTPAPSVAAS